jgi:hypothetical protein
MLTCTGIIENAYPHQLVCSICGVSLYQISVYLVALTRQTLKSLHHQRCQRNLHHPLPMSVLPCESLSKNQKDPSKSFNESGESGDDCPWKQAQGGQCYVYQSKNLQMYGCSLVVHNLFADFFIWWTVFLKLSSDKKIHGLFFRLELSVPCPQYCLIKRFAVSCCSGS